MLTMMLAGGSVRSVLFPCFTMKWWCPFNYFGDSANNDDSAYDDDSAYNDDSSYDDDSAYI